MSVKRSKTKSLLAVLLTIVLLISNATAALAAESDSVVFSDNRLKQALIDAGAVPDGDGNLTEGALAVLTGTLDLSDKAISDLSGLSYATGISGLNLSGNAIRDISALSAMTSLLSLDLSSNYIDTTDGSPAMQVIEDLTLAGCSVTYVPQKGIPAVGVELNQTTAVMLEGRTITLTASVLPSSAANKKVTWLSDKPAVATVSEGLVSAVSAGTATITATSQDGLYTASCTVTVKSAVLASSVYYVGTSAVRGIPERLAVEDFKHGFKNDASDIKLYDKGGEYSGDNVTTGLAVKLVVGGEVAETLDVVVEGDVTGDGKISMHDYSLVKLHLLNKKLLADAYINAADYNRDGRVDVADYVRMRLHILGFGDTGGALPQNLPTVSDPRIRRFLDIALAQLGKPYVWGGDQLADGGFDCSGFIYFSLNQSGYKVGRTTADSYSRYSKWKYVDKDELQPGDLMFYVSDSDPTRIGHIGIYLGNGYHVHASSDYQCIIICGVEGWYKEKLSHGRRVFL